jgi:transposase
VLEDAGVKLSSVATDIMGASGRDMMRALIAGSADPEALADPARGKLRAKLPALQKALTSRFRAHHAFLLERMLSHPSDLEADIAAVSERIEAAIAPFEGRRFLLESIPGVGQRSAEVILAEIGLDLSVFPTEGHLASWAGMCPGQRESAAKRGSAKTRKGSKWLGTALIESARRAARLEGHLPFGATCRSAAVEATRGPSWLWRTRFSSPPIAVSAPASSTSIPAPRPCAT